MDYRISQIYMGLLLLLRIMSVAAITIFLTQWLYFNNPWIELLNWIGFSIGLVFLTTVVYFLLELEISLNTISLLNEYAFGIDADEDEIIEKLGEYLESRDDDWDIEIRG